ncbi:transposase [Acetobacter thailandicus]
MEEDWQADLEQWLVPYLEGLGNKTRRKMCPAYIAGLIGPGDRKSIQPMAMRHNPDLRSIYLSLTNKGKHAKVALTALMRRLVILANVLLRNNRLWEARHT